jgi:cell division protein ZapA
VTQAKKTRANVEIYGKNYTLVGDEDLHHMRMVASVVDEKMREIYQVNKSLDTTRLAVLTAVNTMNDYLKLKEAYDALEQKLNKKED